MIVSDVSGFLIRRQNRPDILSAGEEVLNFVAFECQILLNKRAQMNL